MKPIWYPLFILGVLALAGYIAWRNYPWWHPGDLPEKWFSVAMGTVLTVLACGLSLIPAQLLSEFIGGRADKVWRKHWSAKLVAMRSADRITGSLAGGLFVLSGRIGSSLVYHYYAEASDGAFKPHTWEPDDWTSIYEEDRNDGEILQYEVAFKKPWMAWLGEFDQHYRMDFHIPRGSLKQQFSLE